MSQTSGPGAPPRSTLFDQSGSVLLNPDREPHAFNTFTVQLDRPKAKPMSQASIAKLQAVKAPKGSGKGGGGRGLGKGGVKRHRKQLKDTIVGISKPAIRRLARRGGVKRISQQIYEEGRSCLKVWLENVLRSTIAYTEHARRKTVTVNDVVYGLKRQGWRPQTLYGF